MMPVHEALLKRNLILGADRECVLTSFLLCGVLLYAGQSFGTFLFVAALQGGLLMALRMLAKRDQWSIPILIRSWARVGYLPAKSHPDGTTT